MIILLDGLYLATQLYSVSTCRSALSTRLYDNLIDTIFHVNKHQGHDNSVILMARIPKLVGLLEALGYA